MKQMKQAAHINKAQRGFRLEPFLWTQISGRHDLSTQPFWIFIVVKLSHHIEKEREKKEKGGNNSTNCAVIFKFLLNETIKWQKEDKRREETEIFLSGHLIFLTVPENTCSKFILEKTYI